MGGYESNGSKYAFPGFNRPTEVSENFGVVVPSLEVIWDTSTPFMTAGQLFPTVSEGGESFVSGDDEVRGSFA